MDDALMFRFANFVQQEVGADPYNCNAMPEPYFSCADDDERSRLLWDKFKHRESVACTSEPERRCVGNPSPLVRPASYSELMERAQEWRRSQGVAPTLVSRLSGDIRQAATEILALRDAADNPAVHDAYNDALALVASYTSIHPSSSTTRVSGLTEPPAPPA